MLCIDRASCSGRESITFAQYQLLDAVDRVGRAGNARVAELAGVSGATATQALTRFEQRGLLRRQCAAVDGRAVTIALSARGRELLEETSARGCGRGARG